MDRELRGQHLEGRLFVGLALFYGEADESDLVERILSVCRTGDGRLGEVRKVLADGEAHFSARFDIDRQVVDFSLRKPNSALSLSEAESVSVWVTVVPLQPSDTCTLAAS